MRWGHLLLRGAVHLISRLRKQLKTVLTLLRRTSQTLKLG